jgi:hypothetical protein
LPETFREVLQDERDQAVVVATLQFSHMIIHVSAAWKSLRGYTKAEAVHGILLLIQRPDWNRERANQSEPMIQRVVETLQSQETVLINSSKSGRPFTSNRLTVGNFALGKETFARRVSILGGILEEVPGEGNKIESASSCRMSGHATMLTELGWRERTLFMFHYRNSFIPLSLL